MSHAILAFLLSLPAEPRAAPRDPTAAEIAKRKAMQDFQDCLDDRDLTAEDNDGQCEEP